MPLSPTENSLIFESLFNNAGLGIAIINTEGLIIRVNAKLCAMGGYREEEYLQKPFKEFLQMDIVEGHLELFMELLTGVRDSHEMEQFYFKKCGQISWCLVTVSVARQDDGSVFIIAMVQDIDDRKRAESALLESEKQLKKHNAFKDKLFSIIAHDLRGPVSSTASALEVIEKNSSLFSKEKIVTLVSKLKNNASKTAEMLESLLTWSHSQLKGLTFTPVTLSLAKETSQVVGQLKQQAYAKGIAIEVHVAEDVKIQADKHMLHIILRNLLSNAIKFSHSGSVVLLKAEAAYPFVHVSVTDTGVGLSAENLSKLLDSNTTGITSFGTNGEKGTGLGINLCMEYIERHGGTLQIASELGYGSTFTFAVPAAQKAPTMVDPEQAVSFMAKC